MPDRMYNGIYMVQGGHLHFDIVLTRHGQLLNACLCLVVLSTSVHGTRSK